MSDIKPKLILRPGANISEKSPSPSTKLMLNHGKPNFTINRSKSKIDTQSPPPTEASQVVLKSTTFNGFIKPSTLNISTENEMNKVVLRRTKLPEPHGKPAQDDEPEFIKAQRKIAERLAKENNLDFENRKSGYFTHVMMSPTSPTKTMEVPVIESAKIQKATVVEPEVAATEPIKPAEALVDIPEKVAEKASVVEPVTENSQTTVEEPKQNGVETADLIQLNGTVEEEKQTEVTEAAKALVEDVVQKVPEELVPVPVQNGGESVVVENGVKAVVENGVQNNVENGVQNGLSNGESQPKENGHATATTPQSEVNVDAKTVVSSKELSSEPNNPDTVKGTKEVESSSTDAELLQDIAKLKFDINADSEDVKVTPMLRVNE